MKSLAENYIRNHHADDLILGLQNANIRGLKESYEISENVTVELLDRAISRWSRIKSKYEKSSDMAGIAAHTIAVHRYYGLLHLQSVVASCEWEPVSGDYLA